MAAKRPSAVDSARQRTPATFVAFDVLWHEGDVTALSYIERPGSPKDLVRAQRAPADPIHDVEPFGEQPQYCGVLGESSCELLP